MTLWRDYLNLYLPSQLPVFGCGIIAFYMVIKKEMALSNFNLMALAILFITSLIWEKAIPPNVTFGFGFLVLLVVLSKYSFKPIVNVPMRFLGTISYSIYLVHFAVHYWLDRWDVLNLIDPATGASGHCQFHMSLNGRHDHYHTYFVRHFPTCRATNATIRKVDY